MSTFNRVAENSFDFGDVQPCTLPLTVAPFADLSRNGHFDTQSGQVELTNGRIVQINPQGPHHASSIDILGEWSVEQAPRQFWIRVEKPIELVGNLSSPEPDMAWVKRQSYAERHPQAEDISLLIEASVHSVVFDQGEMCEIYAVVGIPEYWQIDVRRREIRDPQGRVFSTISTHGQEESISLLCLPSAELENVGFFNGANSVDR